MNKKEQKDVLNKFILLTELKFIGKLPNRCLFTTKEGGCFNRKSFSYYIMDKINSYYIFKNNEIIKVKVIK